MDKLTTHEAAAVMCLLTIRANNEHKPVEVELMVSNRFFSTHILNKIDSPRSFVQRYNEGLRRIGPDKMEQLALSSLKSAYPAFRTKTLALMTLIASADNEYDQNEKDLIARTSLALSVTMEDIQPEIDKMQPEAPLNPTSTPEETAKQPSDTE